MTLRADTEVTLGRVDCCPWVFSLLSLLSLLLLLLLLFCSVVMDPGNRFVPLPLVAWTMDGTGR